MKFIAGVAFLACVCDLAQGESCTNATDCTATGCRTSTHALCEHPPGSDDILPDAGLCTCAIDTCLYPANCMTPKHPELNCGDDRRHCYDNKCICSGFAATAMVPIVPLH